MDLSQAVGQFSDDLFKLVVPKSHDENALVSPLSLSIAMSMLMAGAKNNSQLQLRNVLKLPAEVDVSEVNNYFQELLIGYRELVGRNKTSSASDTPAEQVNDEDRETSTVRFLTPGKTRKASVDKSISSGDSEQILISNMALVSKLYELLSEYEDNLKAKYQAEISRADFTSEGETIVQRVNEWVSDSTKGLIPEVLNEPPPADTALMLLNCVYFRGNWMKEFEDAGNRDFHASKTRTRKVPFMAKQYDYKYLDVPFNSTSELVEMVEVPYKGRTKMILILPPESASANDLIAHKSLHELLMQLVLNGRCENIHLSMPKFTFKFNMKMNDIFTKLGAVDIFNSSLADLSGIINVQDQQLFVSKITHSTVIEVDEEGTKAAAATGESFFTFICSFQIKVQIELSIRNISFITLLLLILCSIKLLSSSCSPDLFFFSATFWQLTCYQPPKNLTLDRPFIFFIYDSKTKLPIFLGKLQDPIN